MSDGFWTDEEHEASKKVTVDGVVSPGVVDEVEFNGVTIKLDEVNGYGLSGTFLRETGLGLATFGARLFMNEAADRVEFNSANWKRAIKPAPQGSVQRIRTVSFPLIDINAAIGGITPQWVFEGVPFVVYAKQEGGGAIMWLRFKNKRKPLPQFGKPASAANAAKGKVPDKFQQAIGLVGNLIKAEAAKGKV